MFVQPRNEELIPAGSVPEKPMGKLDQVHRQIAFTLLTSTLLLALMVYIFTSLLSTEIMLAMMLPLVLQFFVWYNFRSKTEWAFRPAMLCFATSIGVFALLGLIFILSGLMSGQFGDLLLGVLLCFSATASVKRLQILRNKIFQAWYFGNVNINESLNLSSDEVMGYCKSCLSVLAIRPFTMDPNSICPNCKSALVSKDTLVRLGMFEEE